MMGDGDKDIHGIVAKHCIYKGFQITQYRCPVCSGKSKDAARAEEKGGAMINAEDAMDGRTVRIKHLEDVNAQLLAACEEAEKLLTQIFKAQYQNGIHSARAEKLDTLITQLRATIAAAKGEVPE